VAGLWRVGTSESSCPILGFLDFLVCLIPERLMLFLLVAFLGCSAHPCL
jgi:hypothetical protein